MAWISEVSFRGNNNALDEFVEITLKPGDDPADFVVSLYDQDGALHLTSGLATGEVTLSSLSGVPHPDNPAFTIYTIQAGIKNSNADANEATGVALTNVATNTVIDFYSADNRPPITPTEGAALGGTSENLLEHTLTAEGESYKWDISGTLTLGPETTDSSVLCFAADTPIQTALGQIPAHRLKVGDQVWTLDHGLQPLLWIAHSRLLPTRQPDQHPIRVAWHGPGVVLSPQHRVLLRSTIALRMFGQEEVLVAAKKLVGLEGVQPVALRQALPVVHLLFDQHEILRAGGELCESLLLGPEALKYLGLNGRGNMRPARPIITGRRLRSLLDRHRKNGRALMTTKGVNTSV